MTKRTIPQYLANGEPLAAAVNAYRAERGGDEPAPTPTKPSDRYRLPPLTTPTEIKGWSLGPSGQDIPEFSSRETAIGASRRMRRGADGSAILDTIGPPALRKRSQ
jgi:hypothetical protein